ncbi:MAG: hypothetical protein QW041_03410 [Candidatus Pacearchaeota archaeon]
MNKLIVLFISIVITVGAIYLYFQHIQTSLKIQDTVLLPLIKGCAENGKNQIKMIVEEQEPRIDINENEIIYSRTINHLCCRTVRIEKEEKNSIINIYEIWGGAECKCICSSEIGAKLKNVPLGEYTINVYEKGKRPESEEQIEQKLIISKNISVNKN